MDYGPSLRNIVDRADNRCHRAGEMIGSNGRGETMKKIRRKPTYGAAIRLARIAVGLFSRPYGWSLSSIGQSLEISERTLARYVSVLRAEMLDAHGGPMVEVVGAGGQRKLRLVS